MMLLFRIFQLIFLLFSEPMLRSDLLPSSHYFQVVRSSWMSFKCLKIRMNGNRTIPGRCHTGNVFQHIRLCSYGCLTWNPITQPSEVDSCKILSHPGSFFCRPFFCFFLQYFRPENIKS